MTIPEILSTFKTIAVVGLSDKPEKPSHSVSKYMLEAGYTIIPVNPMHEQVFGLKCYPNLSSLPDEVKASIEIVNVFRNPSDVPPIVDEAIQIGAKVIWLQLGITHEASAEKARLSGLEVVQNRCILVEHQRYCS
jgi:predicted CoA-binding protein